LENFGNWSTFCGRTHSELFGEQWNHG
jgi:hypothetical protein